MVLAPLGEGYAFLRTRQLEKDLADARLAPELTGALQLSTTMDKSLSGAASKRLLNALTVAIIDPAMVETTEKQRKFVYQLLVKWQSQGDRRPFCRAVIEAIRAWRDEAGLAALRTVARSSQLPEIRNLAAAALNVDDPGSVA